MSKNTRPVVDGGRVQLDVEMLWITASGFGVADIVSSFDPIHSTLQSLL